MMRNSSIDLLRFIAIALVFFRHMRHCPADASPAVVFVTRTLERAGWVGVDLFFVLSGFLVSGLLFREFAKYGEVNIVRFLVRRGFKIYPSFWALIAVTVAWRATQARQYSWQEVTAELLFVQNYFPGLWGHTWSLAIEEHFYLLLALCVGFAVWINRRRDPFRGIPVVVPTIAVVCLFLRWRGAQSLDVSELREWYTPTHLRLDSLALGVLICWLWEKGYLRKFVDAGQKKIVLFCCGAACVSPVFAYELNEAPWFAIYGFPLIALGFGMILISLLTVPVERVAVLRWMSRIGVYSYSIYLWHMPVEYLFEKRSPNWYFYAAAYMVGSLVLGVVMAKVIELPALALRDRLFPAPVRPIKERSEIGPATSVREPLPMQLAGATDALSK